MAIEDPKASPVQRESWPLNIWNYKNLPGHWLGTDRHLWDMTCQKTFSHRTKGFAQVAPGNITAADGEVLMPMEFT